MWANHDWLNIFPARSNNQPAVLAPGHVSLAEFERMTDYIVERYFSRPNYLTINGEPYFSIYELSSFIAGLGGLDVTHTALSVFVRRPLHLAFQDYTSMPCRVRVNGVEVGVQGGFDPYPNLDRPHIQRYDLLKSFREGENFVELEVIDLGAAGHILVDALIESDGKGISLETLGVKGKSGVLQSTPPLLCSVPARSSF
jgi:hypothetical protein